MTYLFDGRVAAHTDITRIKRGLHEIETGFAQAGADGAGAAGYCVRGQKQPSMQSSDSLTGFISINQE